MFCSNQKFSINGDKEETLRATLNLAMYLSGWANTTENMQSGRKPQPSAYTIDPIRGVILFWHEDVPGVTVIPEAMRNETSIVALIQNYLTDNADVAKRYQELRRTVYEGDSWLKNGWECYIPESTYQDAEFGIPSNQAGYAIIGFRPALTRYDK